MSSNGYCLLSIIVLLVQQPLPSSALLNCSNSTGIGPYCNISNALCDVLKPCQNNGICNNANANKSGYVCLCPSGFSGTECQFDYRPCKPNTCWNNGICVETLNTTFNCKCAIGWEGIHCQNKINYCNNVTCQHHGVCRSLFLNYTCECLIGSSGRHCETKKSGPFSVNSSTIKGCSISFGLSLILFLYLCNIKRGESLKIYM